MKAISMLYSPKRKWMSVLILFSFLSIQSIQAQNEATFDKVLMNSGEQKVGKVTSMNDNTISFVHKGETLTYELNKQDINKIEFSSGRVEFINPDGAGSSDANGTGLQAHHNLVAVLPFSYISAVPEKMSDQMGVKIQGDCVTELLKRTSDFKVQDIITTNALLAKHGITDKNITSYTPGELTQILNVEYVVYGAVTVTKTGTSSRHGTYYNGSSKGKKNSGYAVGGGSTNQEYETTVQLNVYNEDGANIYNKSHESFWSSNDAYMTTLTYLIKRSPFYSK